ncbi:glutathione S-transferase family protein [Sneathiella aquimaris]|nr:glutathione S-transferase family protein [Sneathiella aquimaris]
MQQDKYIIYGSEYSPFSVKVRSYLRYKNIDHEWRPRTQDNFDEFQALAKLPLIPLVQCPDGTVLQDSTPIIEKLEERHPDKPIIPDSPEMAFISSMLEEYADEWGNKPMFHYRWWRDEDQIAVSKGLADNIAPNAVEEDRQKLADQLRKRMVPRLSFVGSSEQNKDLIERSLKEALLLLEKHLDGRAFVLGGHPTLADFGLFCQLYGCTQQPTTLEIMTAFPNILDWINRMLDPKAEGELEPWERLQSTLQPFIVSQVRELYLPWATANAQALKAEEHSFSVTLKGSRFTQDPMKYTARSLHALKGKFARLEQRSRLEQILLETDCLAFIVAESW